MPLPGQTAASLYAAFRDGDGAAIVGLLAADIIWVTPAALIWSKGRYQGREEVIAYFGGVRALIDEFTVELDELLECGSRVVAFGRECGRVRATGLRFAAPFAHDLSVRDGRISSLRGYIDTALIARAFDPATPAPASRGFSREQGSDPG